MPPVELYACAGADDPDNATDPARLGVGVADATFAGLADPDNATDPARRAARTITAARTIPILRVTIALALLEFSMGVSRARVVSSTDWVRRRSPNVRSSPPGAVRSSVRRRCDIKGKPDPARWLSSRKCDADHRPRSRRHR